MVRGSSARPTRKVSTAKSSAPSATKCTSGSRSQGDSFTRRPNEDLTSSKMDFGSTEDMIGIPEKDSAALSFETEARRLRMNLLPYSTPATLVEPLTSMKIGLL